MEAAVLEMVKDFNEHYCVKSLTAEETESWNFLDWKTGKTEGPNGVE